jgi:integrase
MTERRTESHFLFTPDRLIKIRGSEKKTNFYDTKVPGLCLIVSPKGSKTFYVYRRVDGRPRHIRIGRFPEITILSARQKSSQINSEIAEGTFAVASITGLTWGEIHRQYVEDSKSRIRSWKDGITLNRTHLPDWNSWPIRGITYEVVAARHAKVGKKSPSVANRLLSLVSSVFKFGVQHGLLSRRIENPAKGIKKFPEKQRKRFLSPDEMDRFFKAVERAESRTFGDFFLMLLFTGHRSGKVKSMAWADINLPQRLWRIETNKNGEEISVHLTEAAVGILESRDQTTEWVFPSATSKTGHITEPKKAWKELCEDAELHDFRIHDLRHTMASWQAINGVSLPIIGASLGHKSMASTARYAHLSLGPVRESVDAATAKMMQVKDGKADLNPKDVQETPTVADDPVGRLTKLKQMLDSDLITHDEFETKKSEILGSL